MYNVLPLIKTHYSLGRSILTLDKSWDDKSKKPKPTYLNSVFDILKDNNLKTLVLVEDNISGLLQASKHSEEYGIKLIFGLRMDVTDDLTQKNEASLTKRAKYIIFARNPNAYQSLLRMWSIAAKDGFYYNPVIDFKTIRKFWSKDFIMEVPFYDSFFELNLLNSHSHVPEIKEFNPVFLLENNELPFDDLLTEKVKFYCHDNKYETLAAQSIFYRRPEDFPAYLTFRCIHNRSYSGASTLEKPELNHMNSDTFNFERWKELNGKNN